MKPTDEDFINRVTSDLMVNMGVAMIQQDLPDDTEMLGITLGEFKKLAQITEKDKQNKVLTLLTITIRPLILMMIANCHLQIQKTLQITVMR